MSKKYIGWGRTSLENGQKSITIVPAKSKETACKIFERLGLPVISKKHILKICIVKYPGPDDVRKLKAAKWDKLKPLDS